MGGLNGQWIERPCAYCALHHCMLSVKQMKAKQCVQRGCWHLRKQEHPYWAARALTKEKRKERKERLCK